MSIVIPCASGIGVLGTITLYHLYLNSIFEGTYKDKLYYLNSHIITLIPILIYLIMILDEVILGQVPSLTFFYIDWIITTPLILTKVGYFTSIPLNSYIYIILLDELMIMSGYVSYITPNNALSYAMFSLGGMCYIVINAIYLKNIKSTIILKQKQNLRYRLFCGLYYSIAFIWIFYPIIHILLKINSITQSTAVIVYVILDILTKGIFTTLLIGSREIYQKHTSWLKNLINKMFHVHPLEINPVQETIEDITHIVKIYDKEENKESITINPDSTDNTNSVKSVRDDNIDTIMKAIGRYKPIKTSVISTMESIDEKEQESP
jgi:bacteriorhodopsin